MPKAETSLLTYAEAEAEFGISHRTLRAAARPGAWPSLKLAVRRHRTKLMRRIDVLKFIAKLEDKTR